MTLICGVLLFLSRASVNISGTDPHWIGPSVSLHGHGCMDRTRGVGAASDQRDPRRMGRKESSGHKCHISFRHLYIVTQIPFLGELVSPHLDSGPPSPALTPGTWEVRAHSIRSSQPGAYS